MGVLSVLGVTRRGVDVHADSTGAVVVWEERPSPTALQRIAGAVVTPTGAVLGEFRITASGGSIYWPRVWRAGGDVWVAAQVSEAEQWRGRVWRYIPATGAVTEVLTLPLGEVKGDRGILYEDAYLYTNTGQFSNQGIAWVEFGVAISVDNAWRSLPAAGVKVWDGDGGWRVGENTTGPDRCLLVSPEGDIYKVFDGVAFEPKVCRVRERLWIAAAGAGGVVRLATFTLPELEGMEDVAEVVISPQPAPLGTVVPRVEEFARFLDGENAGGNPSTSYTRDGYIVHRKGPVIGGTSIHKWDGQEMQLRLEYDSRPHRITVERGGKALAFLWKGMSVGEIRRYPQGWLYRWRLQDLAPSEDHRHPVAMQVVAYYPSSFDIRMPDGELYTAERGLVTALRECTGELTWRDGIPDRSNLRVVEGNSELNYWFTGVRRKGAPLDASARSGLGGWTGLGSTEANFWDPWLHPTTQTREPYDGPLDPPLFNIPPPSGGGGSSMTETELLARARYPIPRDIIQGVFDRLGQEPLLKEEDRGTPGMGLIIYMVNVFVPAMIHLQVTGGVPGSREGWEAYAESAYRKLWETYLREQRGDIAPPQPETLRPFSGRVWVDGV